MLTAEELRRGNAIIPEEQQEEIQAELFKAAREVMVGRMILGDTVTMIDDPGLTDYIDYDQSDVGRAQLVMEWGASQGDDMYDLTRSVTKVPILEKIGTIPRRRMESAERKDRFDIVAELADSLMNSVVQEENTFILQGWERDQAGTYDINGLYQAATTSFTGTDWGDVANILPSISGVIGALRSARIYGPYVMVLHPDQWTELQVSDPTSGLDFIERINKIMTGQTTPTSQAIFMDPTITAGTALVGQPNRAWMRYLVTSEMGMDVWTESNDPKSPVKVAVRMASTIVVRRTAAWAQLTSI